MVTCDMHPLTPKLTELPDQELQDKITDIQNRMGIAYRMGYGQSVVGQLQLLLNDYSYEFQIRQQKMMEEMQMNFGDKISIRK